MPSADGIIEFPTRIVPVPFGVIAIPIFVSVPVAEIVGRPVVAAFASVNSFTAEAVAVNKSNSFPFVSKSEMVRISNGLSPSYFLSGFQMVF